MNESTAIKLPFLGRERTRRGMSKAELERAAEVGVSSIYRAEHGEKALKLSAARGLAGALGVSVGVLAGVDDGTIPDPPKKERKPPRAKPPRRKVGAKKKREPLCALREERGLSQRALARVAGVSQNAISLWERGVCRPSPEHRESVAAALGVSVGKLEGGEPGGTIWRD